MFKSSMVTCGLRTHEMSL